MVRRFTGFLFLAIGSTAFAQQQVISTIAGTPFTFPPSPLPALNAPLGRVGGVAIDTHGNVYVADPQNNLVERFVPGGQMTVVAGNGILGFSGDGGPATSASLNGPYGLAVDSAGNLYIADQYNSRIRKVSGGTITTVAGGGSSLSSGVPATSASLYYPAGVAVDSAGNLYIADTGNGLIREVSGGTITTVAGNGSFFTGGGDGGPATRAALSFPQGVAVDLAGNVYIADTNDNTIRKVSGGTIITLAGNLIPGFSGDGGPAASAVLNGPTALAVDPAGSLYIADTNNNLIRKVSNGTIATFAGNGNPAFSGDGGSATSASLFAPAGVAVDAVGNIYIADGTNERVRKVSSGIIATVAGNGAYSFSGDGGAATSAALNGPTGITLDSAGNLYLVDSFNNRIRKISGGTITTVAGNGLASFSGDGGPATSASLNPVNGVAVDLAGNLYFSDTLNNRIRKVSGGTISTVAGNGNQGYSGDGGLATSASLFDPVGLALDSAGNLYIADSGNNVIRKVSGRTIETVAGSGKCGSFTDGIPATSASLCNPFGVAIDAGGNLYIADTNSSAIRKVSGGILTTVAGGGNSLSLGGEQPATSVSLNFPYAIAVDAAGDLYIADTGNAAIRKVSGGMITTVAGNGNAGLSGDGGPAVNASLNSPEGVFVDPAGNLYIGDTGNNRIREVRANPPTFTASPLGLTFTAVIGALAPPAQMIHIAGSVANLAFTAQANGAPWLTLSATSGTLPFDLQVGVDASQLAAGAYIGTVTITVPAATTAPINVQVAFVVSAAATQRLTLSASSLSFSVTQGAAPTTSQLTLTNQGSGSLNFTATSTSKWISVSPASGSVTAASPVSLTVTANPGTLVPGSYTGTLVIASSNTGQAINVPVTLTINPPLQKIVLSQLGFTFIAVASGGTVLPQTLGIVNGGAGSMNWTAQAITASGSSCGFLSLSTSSGSVAQPLVDTSPVDVSINAQGQGLAPGSYYCQIQVSAVNASNSPQSALVVLDVLPAGSNPGPNVQPSGLVFTNVAGNENPGSKIVMAANVTGIDINFDSSVAYGPSGSGWLQYLPLAATVAPDQPAQIVVQPDFSSLTAGVYRATLTLSFDDGSIRSVGILAVLAPAGTTPASRDVSVRGEPPATGCTPHMLYPIFTQLGAGPNIPAGWPAAIFAEVVDDCSNPVDTGSLVASFSNGDVPLPLMDMQHGQWAASWTPGVIKATGVTVTINAMSSMLSGSAQETTGLASGESQPIVAAQPVSPVTLTPGPFAPGDLMLIQGTGLADAQAPSSSSTLLAIGPEVAPLLYVNPTQVIAMVPPDILVNSTPQLAISRDTSTILLPAVSIAATHPAIWSKDGTGQGQALIYNATSSATTLADASNPAQAGGGIIIYCSGLGAVDAQDNAINVPTVTIGGAPATVSYSGRALAGSYPQGGAPMLLGVVSATSAGLYQITATVPTGLANGPASVIVSSAGQTSQTGVTMMVAGQSSQAPSILPGGVVNAASYAAVPVAPGSLVAIFTSPLAVQPATATTASLLNSLSGVSVTFNGIAAPMAGVSPSGAFPFVTAQVPFEVLAVGQTSATVPVAIALNGVPSAAISTQIVASSPGIFTIPATGQGNAVLVNLADNSIAAPSGSIPGLFTHAIPRGQSAFFYVTGLGAMTPSVVDGSGACPSMTSGCSANATPTVLVGGVPAQVSFAGQAGGFPGVMQINIAIPQNAPTGSSVSLTVKSADGTVTSNTATIAVQ